MRIYEPGALHVRAERDGACRPIGRVYETTLIAIDVCGNVTSSNPITVNVWRDRAHPPTQGTVRLSTGNSQDVRNGTNGTYSNGCGTGSPGASGTIHDDADADPAMEISQNASMSVEEAATALHRLLEVGECPGCACQSKQTTANREKAHQMLELVGPSGREGARPN